MYIWNRNNIRDIFFIFSKTYIFSLLRTERFFLPPSASKSLILYSSSDLIAKWDAAWFINCWIKAVKFFKFTVLFLISRDHRKRYYDLFHHFSSMLPHPRCIYMLDLTFNTKIKWNYWFGHYIIKIFSKHFPRWNRSKLVF